MCTASGVVSKPSVVQLLFHWSNFCQKKGHIAVPVDPKNVACHAKMQAAAAGAGVTNYVAEKGTWPFEELCKFTVGMTSSKTHDVRC